MFAGSVTRSSIRTLFVIRVGRKISVRPRRRNVIAVVVTVAGNAVGLAPKQIQLVLLLLQRLPPLSLQFWV
jgi:hypothetical protein